MAFFTLLYFVLCGEWYAKYFNENFSSNSSIFAEVLCFRRWCCCCSRGMGTSGGGFVEINCLSIEQSTPAAALQFNHISIQSSNWPHIDVPDIPGFPLEFHCYEEFIICFFFLSVLFLFLFFFSFLFLFIIICSFWC